MIVTTELKPAGQVEFLLLSYITKQTPEDTCWELVCWQWQRKTSCKTRRRGILFSQQRLSSTTSLKLVSKVWAAGGCDWFLTTNRNQNYFRKASNNALSMCFILRWCFKIIFMACAFIWSFFQSYKMSSLCCRPCPASQQGNTVLC